MTLVHRVEDGQEESLTSFDFQRGELEQVGKGMTYQQATVDGHVCMTERRGEVDVSFKSRETGQSHACTVGAGELETLLQNLWTKG